MPTYTVKAGDTLGGIAKKLGLSSYNKLSGWQGGYGGSNPNMIQVGEKFTYGGGSSKKSPSKNKVGTTSVQKFANKFEKNQQALLRRQKQEQQGYFDQYQDAINNQQALPDLYNTMQQDLCFPVTISSFNSVTHCFISICANCAVADVFI